jgi:hypothetical protein
MYWFVFVKKIILKSWIITVGQCGGNFCIMFLKIELKCDTCMLGGLYIAIMYNVFSVLSLQSVLINSTPKFVFCCQ